MKRALIVEDGREAYVLAAVRGLACAGWSVGLAGPQRNVRAAASRHAMRWDLLPSASTAAFPDALRALVSEQRYDVVFGGDDVEVLAVSAARDTLGATVPYGSHDSVRTSLDKRRVAEIASGLGITVPTTNDATDDVLRRQQLPAVVKAGLHWEPGSTSPGRLPARVVTDRDELHRAVDEIREAGGTPIVQQVVEGALEAITVLVGRDGRTVAVVQQRALALTVGGTSARAVTVPVDGELVRDAERLVSELGWRGLVNLQFLTDARGTRHLIDVNGRFYGSLALAMAAGVNVAALWVQEWFSGPVPGGHVGRPGVRWQTFDGDLARVRAAGPRAAGLAGVLATAARSHHTLPAWTDPRPAVAWYGFRALRRLRRG